MQPPAMLPRVSAALNSIGNFGYLGLLSLLSEDLAGFVYCTWLFAAWPAAWTIKLWHHWRAPAEGGAAEHRFLRNYGVCEILSLFNPFLQFQTLRQLAANKSVPLTHPVYSDVTGFAQQATYRLPFKDRWNVHNGGVTKQTSHSWDIIGQRFAYDFVIKDQDGRSYSGTGQRLQEYYCFDREVCAPADGIVCETRDGSWDFPNAGKGWVNVFTREIRGNFVVIKHGASEYSLLAHLKRGSILPRVGEQVTAGQAVGRCGNSGMSTEPHLHFQLQSGPDFHASAGLPIRFSNYVEIREGQRGGRSEGYLERGCDCEPEPGTGQLHSQRV